MKKKWLSFACLLLAVLTAGSGVSAQSAANQQTLQGVPLRDYLNQQLESIRKGIEMVREGLQESGVTITPATELPKEPAPDRAAAPVAVKEGAFDASAFSSLQYASEPSGYRRAEPSKYLAQKSMRYAEAAYGNDFTPYLEDGWQDVVLVEDGKPFFQATAENPKMAISQRELELLGQTGKSRAVVASRVVNGSPLILITFAGTRASAGEWLDNLNYQLKDGLHAGFSAVAENFDAGAKNIGLPALAKKLGREGLSLSDLIGQNGEAALWIAGHSQGGGVAQAYIGRCLPSRGYPTSKAICYTIGAPTVASSSFAQDPSAFQIYNIVNSDDLFTKIGSQVRLGADLVYHPDDSFRAKYYLGQQHAYPSFAESEFFSRSIKFFDSVRTTADAIEFVTAYSSYAVESGTITLSGNPLKDGMQLIGKALGYALMPAFEQGANDTYWMYRSNANTSLRIQAYFNRMVAFFGRDNPADLNMALYMTLSEAHQLSAPAERSQPAAYQAAVDSYWGSLAKAVWKSNGRSSDASYNAIEL
jgi:hypothetical protein